MIYIYIFFDSPADIDGLALNCESMECVKALNPCHCFKSDIALSCYREAQHAVRL